MSWKAVEMQVALPRTQDAGRIQEQIQQRGQFMQDIISQAQLQSEETKRRTISDLERSYQLKNDKANKEKSKHDGKPISKKDKQTEYQMKVDHPYLGKRIDINS
ncbi:hypothetical protein KQI76_07385 [Amphibacillus sp. MSJ-3]|uniref:hypothetical protein n=1 Tax=Amphibacillus sp. MSJ-3 TaxID=2841505 RepID=UPI001C0F1DA7|nr:hypothetical protein [Amphibacillus sp. MSJ-3]